VVEMGRRVNPDNPLFAMPVAAVGGAVAAGNSAEVASAIDSDESTLDTEEVPEHVSDRAEGTVVDLDASTSGAAEDVLTSLQASTVELDTSIADIDQLGNLSAEDDIDTQLKAIPGDDLLADTGVDVESRPAPISDKDTMLDAFPVPELEGVVEVDSTPATESAAVAMEADEINLDFDLDELGGDIAAQTTTAETGDENESPLLESFEASLDSVPDQGGDSNRYQIVSNEPSLDAVSADEPVFDLDLDEMQSDSGSQAASVLAADDQPSGGDAAEIDDLQWDEAATKLDLAKAYIDMGDTSGAKSIIEEVLKEGNEGQRKQAAELAAQLAATG